MKTINDVKNLNKEKGFYFFSPDTMRFFASKIATDLIADKYFITSEKKCFNDERRVYTVRAVDWETGGIETQGDFGGFKRLTDAEKYIETLLNKDSESCEA